MVGKIAIHPQRWMSLDMLRRLRWQMRRVLASLRYGKSALESSPIIFGNSFPKSGTHLLAQVLQAFPQIGLAIDRGMGPVLTYVRFTGRRRSIEEILRDLNQLKPGDVSFGHIIAAPEIRDGWRQERVAHFFMLRDPRDVVVSHAHYLGSKAVQNVHHLYYRSLPTIEDRIRASILGRPDWEGDFPNIRERFELYLDWLNCPDICVLRYEEFVLDRNAALSKMLRYAQERGFQMHLEEARAIERLSIAIDPLRSFTFRSGKIGDWRSHFTAEHCRLFKDITGDLLVKLGYEIDQDW